MKRTPFIVTAALCLFGLAGTVACADTPTLTIDAAHPTGRVSPMLYGLMTEEINHSYDGGLYAELIQNRTFQDDPATPAHWSIVQDAGGTGSISLDETQPHGDTVLTRWLKLDATKASPGHRVGIANDGYWGIPVRPNTTYHAIFRARSADRSAASDAPMTVSIESSDGSRVFATANAKVERYAQGCSVELTTGSDVTPTTAARFVIATTKPGTYYFNLVSLTTPTFGGRSNGNRIDLMDMLNQMKPAFLRLPGGNYLEGDTVATRFDWKRTLGPLDQRPGHAGPWRYRSSDGLGLLEYLEWCEDMRAEPLLAVFAGYALRGETIPAGPALQPYVEDALEEIEYVTGDPKTTVWGARRAKDGHPDPFPLTYVEIGNEDGAERQKTYDARFAQFYDAIKAKYPTLKIISTVGGQDGLGRRQKLTSRTPDAFDEHYYRTAFQMEEDAGQYDHYSRTGPKTFVGEWATREGSPTTNMNAALGDAAWMTGMERNSDVVTLSCYAPLFVNVNPGAMQWKSDLIGYDALTSFGSPSYYAQKMFSLNHGDTILPIAAENIPTQTYQPPTPRNGVAPAPRQIPTLFFVATNQSTSGTLYVKVVNTAATAQPVALDVTGAKSVASAGTAITLHSALPTDTNSLQEPTKIVPITTRATALGSHFTYTFAPYSVTILVIPTER